ncbi:MAG: hypothetical protein ACYDHT_07055, partial [Solirubrobacteraceae bacterium]
VLSLMDEGALPDADLGASALSAFIDLVSDERARGKHADALEYYEAARSASNDLKQRAARIRIIRAVLSAAK